MEFGHTAPYVKKTDVWQESEENQTRQTIKGIPNIISEKDALQSTFSDGDS